MYRRAPSVDVVKRPGGRRLRAALLLLCLVGLWVSDGIIRGRRVQAALEQAGYRETITARNLWPRRCRITDYEGVFWGRGPALPETQGYVCISYLRAPEVHKVGFDEDTGVDLYREI